jgi:uncharacterized RmlC-like cupin family protein
VRKSVKVVSTHQARAVHGAQNQRLFPTITQSNCGTSRIAAGFVDMPPAHVAKPHYHEYSELIIFFTEGRGVAFIGPDYEPHFLTAGDFLYVPEGVIHFGINLDETQRFIGVEIRTDPHFNDDLILVPEVEASVEQLAADYCSRYARGELSVPAHWATQPSGPYQFQAVESAASF